MNNKIEKEVYSHERSKNFKKFCFRNGLMKRKLSNLDHTLKAISQEVPGCPRIFYVRQLANV